MEQKIKTLDKIKEVLGTEKMTRKELLEKSGLTKGQLAGCIYKSQHKGGILKFNDKHFYIMENENTQ